MKRKGRVHLNLNCRISSFDMGVSMVGKANTFIYLNLTVHEFHKLLLVFLATQKRQFRLLLGLLGRLRVRTRARWHCSTLVSLLVRFGGLLSCRIALVL